MRYFKNPTSSKNWEYSKKYPDLSRYSFQGQISQGRVLANQVSPGTKVNNQVSTFFPHRPWIKAGSVLALTGYIGQLACQCLMAGSFLAAQSGAVEAMENEGTPYVFSNKDEMTDKVMRKILMHSEDEKTLGRASQVSWRWYDLIASLDRPTLAFDREREELIGRILEATNAEFSPIAVARRNPKLQAIHHLLIEPETLLMTDQERSFLLSSDKKSDHPFFGGIVDRERRLAANGLCPGNVLSQYRRYREHCVTLQGDALDQYITPKAIMYIDDQCIYRISRPLAYRINSINGHNLSQRENDAGNHAVCQLGNPGRSVHFKNNNCHTDLSPAMESAMYGFYSLIAPSSVTPSFFMRVEGLPVKRPDMPELMAEWNEVEQGKRTLETFKNAHADKQASLFIENPQNFILQGSRTAEGMRLDKFLEKVAQGEASYETINKESFSYHILLSLLFNPSDYKADNLFLSPEGHIVGIDNDGCLAHPIIYLGTKQREYHVGVKNVLYLLPLMEEEVIHENVIKTFKNLNVPLTLLRWMSFLDAQDKRHRTTFDRQGLERPVEDGHSFPVRLVPGTMASLYEGLRNLQLILSDSWGMTHQQLLMKLQPLVGEAYQAHLNLNPSPLEAMSIIYGRTEDLQKLLPHRIADLQNQAQGKDAYTQNRKASLAQEIESVLSKLQEDGNHLAQILDYLVHHLPGYAPYLSALLQDPKCFKKMLAVGASVPSLRWLLANKSQNTATALQWEPKDLITYARTFMPQIPKSHLKGLLNPILSLILEHFGEWADELLPTLPESAWHQIVQEQGQQQVYNKKILDYLRGRDPAGLNRLDANRKTPLDIAFAYLKDAGNVKMVTDLITWDAWQMSLSGRQYRNLKQQDLPKAFWQTFQTLQEHNAKVNWVVTLEELFPLAKRPGENTIQGTSNEIRLLTETVLRQLNDPHHEITQGRRKVVQVATNGCFAYLKFYPELVGLEEAVGELTRRTIGFGAPYGELFRFPDGTPVWVSQGIPGQTLQWVLTKDPNRLTRLDSVSTTQLILMAMLTNPEDGKPDNYIVEPLPDPRGGEPLYRLSCPDNDHGFVPAFVKAKPDKGGVFTKPELVVQVKTILYCLDLMNQPIPEETKALFLTGDPLVLMQGWLDVMDRRNRRYEALYPSREASVLFKDHQCFMGVPFQKGMISHLYSKWVRFQDCLWEKSLTPLELLNKVEPRLANRYRTAFEHPRNKTVWDRFKWVDGDFYHQQGDHWTTVTASGSILTSQNIPMQESALEAIRKGTGLGSKQAIAELKEIADQKGQEGLSISHMATDAQREKFLKNFDFSLVAPSEQRKVINQLIPHAANFRNLILKNCKVLDDGTLQNRLLLGNLVCLDLNGCSAVTHDILPTLSQNMPGLAVLNLSNLPKLRWMAKAGLINYGPIPFRQLQTLNLSNCTALEAIDLDAPNLQNLWAAGVRRLEVLKVKAAINYDILYGLVEAAPKLKPSQVDLMGCPHIKAGAKIWEVREDIGKALSQNDLGAQHRLGMFFFRLKDYEECMRWYQKTIDQGDAAVLNIIRNLGIVEMRIPIPLSALGGHEALYERFLMGALIYRSQKGSDVGRIDLPIAALVNPLEGTFDLSQCGDVGEYLSISTGYRKEKKAENVKKIEIWLAPRFLIEKELKTTASHFKKIYSDWKEIAEVGLFWTCGGDEELGDYDYLITENMDNLFKNNLYKKCYSGTRQQAGKGVRSTTLDGIWLQKKFMFIFGLK